MLIPFEKVLQFCDIKGIIHVGGHTGEERKTYDKAGIKEVIWVEGNPKLAALLRAKFKDQKVINAIVLDKEQDVNFNLASNGASSSVFPLGTHKKHHPHIKYIDKFPARSTTLNHIIEHPEKYNFLNLDIQGAELAALKGYNLQYVDYIYSEVNTEEVYEDCPLITEMDKYLSGYRRVATQITKYGWGDALWVR